MRQFSIRLAIISIALAFVTAFSVAFAQTTHEVHMLIEEVEGEFFPEFYFEPSGLYIEPGDTIRFIADSPHHTVTALHQQHGFPVTRVPEGVGPFSSPVVPIGETWEYTFEQPGVYDIVCIPHDFLGMAMRVVVGEASGPGAEPLPEELATQPGSASILRAPALDPQNIIEAGTVSWSEFGAQSRLLPFFMQDVEPPAAPQN